MIKVEINDFGFYSVKNKPTVQELEEYYNKKYYQGAQGSYELNYSEEEIDYFFKKIKEKIHIVSKFKTLTNRSAVIDIGCGEGWVLKYFRNLGIEVTGLDYSSYGCEKFNPDCSQSVMVGDVYQNIERLFNEEKSFDLVWLDNVLEHVIDPFDLLEKCRKILSDDGVLMVEVPNDFSVLQRYALEKGYIDREFWIAYPDHLSYFNNEGLTNLAKAAGLRSVFAIGDFPVDINLLNPNTNYISDKSKGKSCYQAKYKFENLLHSISIEHAVNFYRSLMDLGIGRCLTTFLVKE